MEMLHRTIPHYIKVQMGPQPDPLRDGQGCIYSPLDETADGIGARLAEMAIAISNANKILSQSEACGVITNVDGNQCRIPLPQVTEASRSEHLAIALSALVAPSGWMKA